MKKFDEINIIPFIDVMLVLLAIVLITASFIPQGKIPINLPKSSTQVTMTQDDIAKLLTLNGKGEWFLNDQPITLTDLNIEISGWNITQKVTLKVDANTSFQHFVDATDLLTKYHISNVAIVTMKPQE